MHLCNRVDRRSKSQNISELAFSLNRYHNSATPLFYSETQSDISFLIILCKETYLWHNLFLLANVRHFFLNYQKIVAKLVITGQSSHVIIREVDKNE